MILKKIALIIMFLYGLKAHANEKLVLILDWFPNPNHAPIFVAKEQGFFAKNGLDVAIITPADPNDPPKWIAMGKGDIALDYEPHVLLEITRGLPIKLMGTLIDQPLNALVVLKKDSLNKLSDLKGKKIAYSSPEIDLVILKAMLNRENLSLEDIVPINVHYDLTQALLSKKVDAAIGLMRNFELIQLKLLGQEGRAFFPEDYAVPPYSELVFIAKESAANNRFVAFFKALNEGKDYLLKHPEASFQQVALQHGELNTPLNHAAWFNTLDKFPQDLQQIDAQQCKKIAEFLSKDLKIKISQKACEN